MKLRQICLSFRQFFRQFEGPVLGSKSLFFREFRQSFYKTLIRAHVEGFIEKPSELAELSEFSLNLRQFESRDLGSKWLNLRQFREFPDKLQNSDSCALFSDSWSARVAR